MSPKPPTASQTLPSRTQGYSQKTSPTGQNQSSPRKPELSLLRESTAQSKGSTVKGRIGKSTLLKATMSVKVKFAKTSTSTRNNNRIEENLFRKTINQRLRGKALQLKIRSQAKIRWIYPKGDHSKMKTLSPVKVAATESVGLKADSWTAKTVGRTTCVTIASTTLKRKKIKNSKIRFKRNRKTVARKRSQR